VPVLRVQAEGAAPTFTVVHLHGGGYAFGSPSGSLQLLAGLAQRLPAEIISVDYRLAPEHPYPAAVQDAVAVYRHVLEAHGSGARLAVVGESAGGGLALATLLSARKSGLAQPAAVAVLSPWADLTNSGQSMDSNASADPSVTRRSLEARAEGYLRGHDARAPLASPLFADLTGLPPLLVQAGSHEVLLDDALRLAANAAKADVDVVLDVVAGAPHVFQAFAALLDEGRDALDRVCAFLQARVSDTPVVAA
jgi:monoterpene epsilon-lactone hydrolase